MLPMKIKKSTVCWGLEVVYKMYKITSNNDFCATCGNAIY